MIAKSLKIANITIGLLCATVIAQGDPGRVSAGYLFDVKVLGSELGMLRPQQVRYDARHQEYYVADTGNDRIVILDENGLSEFELSANDVFHVPIDVAVLSNGEILVLGSMPGGKSIQVFDYDGDYLHPFPMHSGPAATEMDITSMAADAADLMYLLDSNGQRILIYDANGEFLSQISLFDELTEKDRGEQVLGNLSVVGDLIYVPAPMIGSVYCYKKDGTFVKMIGQKGGTYGELSFPIAVSQDSKGNMLVLDKHRHSIVAYDSQGKPIGEIGGKGMGSGWFYHPISMVIDSRDRIWVAQVFQNRIQVLQLSGPDGSKIAEHLGSSK